MVRLVPIEEHPNSMVLLVNMHLIKGTSIIFLCGLAGYRAIPIHKNYSAFLLGVKANLFCSNRTIGMAFSVGTNRTIGTNGRSEIAL